VWLFLPPTKSTREKKGRALCSLSVLASLKLVTKQQQQQQQKTHHHHGFAGSGGDTERVTREERERGAYSSS